MNTRTHTLHLALLCLLVVPVSTGPCQPAGVLAAQAPPASARASGVGIIAPGARLERLAGGFEFTEGPASDRDGNVYFTDQPNNRIMKWSVDGTLTTFLQPAGRANGMFFDAQGNLLACADEHTELWSIAPGGTHVALASRFEGKPLNGPNDVWARKDGALYFTDPFYKRPWWSYSTRPQDSEQVYFLSADRKTLKRVTADLQQPNGIVGTPDGRTLFVSDIRAGKTYAYDIQPDGSLSNKRLRCELGSDGMTLDAEGNLYLTGRGVSVFDPDGKKIEQIDVPEPWTANVTFGGRDHRTLFITASKGLYAIAMRVAGADAARRPAEAASGAIGIFSRHGDIGAPKIAGSAAYDPAAQEYRVQASGTNMWAGKDEFHFLWNRIAGDFILQARVEFLGAGVDPHRKAGLMVRSSLDGASAHVNVSRHGDGLTSLQFRRTAGAGTEEIRSELNGPDVLQLERKGETYTMSVARFGDPYSTKELTGVTLGDNVYVGIYLCAHNPEVSEQAILRNVRLIRPVKDGFQPYRDYIGSDVELLDVETGARRTVHHVEDSIQAPNWTPDGSRLIMNRNGRIYGFDLSSRLISDIDTGSMTRNNNDHSLSFDGKMLGLSGGQPSVVFTVPVAGGAPVQVTPTGPSYLHGWSPDGKRLAFTGQRNGDFDIYVVPSAGGPEIRLTSAPGLDDGPEFTPDGKWIYFNSTRTGRMQVWRMRPDGSGQEQLTFDDFNNWFPHVSPDGKTVVFITYGPEIPPAEHPWYKRVYIRKMPMDGGKPVVVAYVYGGQGSMNVNSWAPDSKRIAFVSNTGTLQ